MVAWTLSPSPTAESALEAWERAKGFITERLGGLPKVLMHHDQGGAFLSYEWVGTLLLRDRQRLSYSLVGAKGVSPEGYLASGGGELFWAGQGSLKADQWGGQGPIPGSPNFRSFPKGKAFAKQAELKGVIGERIRYYGESRLHTGLGYRTPGEVMEEELERLKSQITSGGG